VELHEIMRMLETMKMMLNFSERPNLHNNEKNLSKIWGDATYREGEYNKMASKNNNKMQYLKVRENTALILK